MTIIASIFAILLSGLLYRVPRGGPDLEWWHRYFKYGLGSAGGSWAWATISALLFWIVLGFPIWIIPILIVLLVAGESVGYMKWVSDEKVDVLPLSIRGLILFNPLMGIIYYLCHKNKDAWPNYPAIFDGWTAWAELFCGFSTATFVMIGLSIIF